MIFLQPWPLSAAAWTTWVLKEITTIISMCTFPKTIYRGAQAYVTNLIEETIRRVESRLTQIYIWFHIHWLYYHSVARFIFKNWYHITINFTSSSSNCPPWSAIFLPVSWLLLELHLLPLFQLWLHLQCSTSEWSSISCCSSGSCWSCHSSDRGSS